MIFEALDGAVIRNAALRTRGAAGPSGLDAFGWRRLCTSFQRAYDDLCCSLALVARKLCTSCVDPDGIIAMVACRLIALNKQGVVTLLRTVEPSATGIKIFDRRNFTLIS